MSSLGQNLSDILNSNHPPDQTTNNKDLVQLASSLVANSSEDKPPPIESKGDPPADRNPDPCPLYWEPREYSEIPESVRISTIDFPMSDTEQEACMFMSRPSPQPGSSEQQNSGDSSFPGTTFQSPGTDGDQEGLPLSNGHPYLIGGNLYFNIGPNNTLTLTDPQVSNPCGEAESESARDKNPSNEIPGYPKYQAFPLRAAAGPYTGRNKASTGESQVFPGLKLVEYIGDQFVSKNPHTRRTIILNPGRQNKNDPVVLYRFFQFSCPCSGKVWLSPLFRAKDGCFCRDCHHFTKPFGFVDGLTPYLGHELCYAKFECHNCGRSWSCQKSRSNFPVNCFGCDTIVYPYYQVAHSALRKKMEIPGFGEESFLMGDPLELSFLNHAQLPSASSGTSSSTVDGGTESSSDYSLLNEQSSSGPFPEKMTTPASKTRIKLRRSASWLCLRKRPCSRDHHLFSQFQTSGGTLLPLNNNKEPLPFRYPLAVVNSRPIQPRPVGLSLSDSFIRRSKPFFMGNV